MKVEDDPGDVAGEEDDDDAEEDESLPVVLVQLLGMRGCRGRTHHLKSIQDQFKINFLGVIIQKSGPHYLQSFSIRYFDYLRAVNMVKIAHLCFFRPDRVRKIPLMNAPRLYFPIFIFNDC